MTGIPDGMGYYESGGSYWVWMQHELSNTASTDFSKDFTGTIGGARISVFQFDTSWRCKGGRNLITKLVRDGVEVGTVTVDAAAKTVAQTGYKLGRFCSGAMAATGFVDPVSNTEVPVWFAAEEQDGNSQGWACYPSGTAEAITGLGRYSKEQVFPLKNFRATNNTKTVLISTEDGDSLDSEVYMWVGNQTTTDPNGLAAANGKLYVLKITGVDTEATVGTLDATSGDLLVPTTATAATWSEVPGATATAATGVALKAFAEGSTSGTRNSTSFTRVEDLHEDPANPGTLWFATTGGRPDNKFGRLYKLVLNTTDPIAAATVQRVLQGGGSGGTGNGATATSQGVAYDNLVVDSKGKIVIQEDRNSTVDTILNTERRNGRTFTFNPADSKIQFLFECNQAAIDAANPGGVSGSGPGTGNWETSGIFEGPAALATSTRVPYLFGVQAHSVVNASGSTTALNGVHVEGGQLLLAKPSSLPTGVAWSPLPGAVPAWNVGQALALTKLGQVAP
jgi:glycerophosphoryl diester phosphodiesterase